MWFWWNSSHAILLFEPPIIKVVCDITDTNPIWWLVISQFFCQNNINFSCLDDVKNTVWNSDRTKSVIYRSLNPNLETHHIYHATHFIPEYERLVFTRIRLQSHYLKVETDRWKIPPIPYENRICFCNNGVQNEKHIIESCIISQIIRDNNPDVWFNSSYVLNRLESGKACHLIYKIYSFYVN